MERREAGPCQSGTVGREPDRAAWHVEKVFI